MSASEFASPSVSKYDKYENTADIERAAIELAIDFIDSNVLGSIEIAIDETGLIAIKVTRERFSDPMNLLVNDEIDETDMTFSPSFVSEQMDLNKPAIRTTRSGVSVGDIEDE